MNKILEAAQKHGDTEIIIKFTDSYSRAYMPFVMKQQMQVEWLYEKLGVKHGD